MGQGRLVFYVFHVRKRKLGVNWRSTHWGYPASLSSLLRYAVRNLSPDEYENTFFPPSLSTRISRMLDILLVGTESEKRREREISCFSPPISTRRWLADVPDMCMDDVLFPQLPRRS